MFIRQEALMAEGTMIDVVTAQNPGIKKETAGDWPAVEECARNRAAGKHKEKPR